MKKIISLLLTLVMVFSVAAMPSAMAVSDVPASVHATLQVDRIKKYGNLMLDASIQDFLNAGYQLGDVVSVSFLGQTLSLPVCSSFSDVDSGTAAVFLSATETDLQIAINMGDFATTYGIAVKETMADKSFQWHYAEGVNGPVEFTISLDTAGGYYEEYLMHQLAYTSVRTDYPHLNDTDFANFRAVAATGMGKNVLYRTTSPIDPSIGRSAIADAALREAGVTVVMNLSDTKETAVSYAGYENSYYATTNYLPLNMGVDFAAPDFQQKLAEGLRFFAENKGIYAVHCKEGKDRTGFVIAVLECLMGGTAEEVVSDYMTTYSNFYGVMPEDARYAVIANSNIVKSLQIAFGIADLYHADLAQCATVYLRQLGLAESEITALKANLSATEKASQSAAVYVVMPGDCLWNIARRYYGSGSLYPRLAEANHIRNPHLIRAGQTLLIPAI